ncbi:MAG: serine kinase, partial [Bryobacteraceae bacterium]
ASLPPAGRFEDRPDEWRTWLFAEMRSHFDDAVARKGSETRDFEIGGKRIRMNFAGADLGHTLTRALAHLTAPSQLDPELTICVWDSTNHKPDSFLLKAYLAAVTHDWWDFVNPRGQLLDFHKPPFMAAYHPGSQVLSVLDLSSNTGLYWRNAANPLPYYEAGSPFRTMLHWWFRARGMQFVHAASVGANGRGVLLVGKGGSGKSTSALVCLNAGLQYLGDDYCVVAVNPEPTVHSLYNTCKLVGEADLERFPGLAQRVWNRERASDDKATVFLQEHWPERLGRCGTVQAILIPQVTGKRNTALRPGTRMEALTALAPTTLAQLPSSDAQDLRTMKEIVHSAPVFVLELGTDLSQIPDAIERILNAAPVEVVS